MEASVIADIGWVKERARYKDGLSLAARARAALAAGVELEDVELVDEGAEVMLQLPDVVAAADGEEEVADNGAALPPLFPEVDAAFLSSARWEVEASLPFWRPDKIHVKEARACV